MRPNQRIKWFKLRWSSANEAILGPTPSGSNCSGGKATSPFLYSERMGQSVSRLQIEYGAGIRESVRINVAQQFIRIMGPLPRFQRSPERRYSRGRLRSVFKV